MLGGDDFEQFGSNFFYFKVVPSNNQLKSKGKLRHCFHSNLSFSFSPEMYNQYMMEFMVDFYKVRLSLLLDTFQSIKVDD